MRNVNLTTFYNSRKPLIHKVFKVHFQKNMFFLNVDRN
nr:MAG TPA: hypothetical protein [Caudoviricetes sp.]